MDRKEYRDYISIIDRRVLDTKKAKIKLISDDEIFVLVNNTNNYWISNRGRLVNNLRGYFYIHKNGYAHYTLTAICGVDTYAFDTYTDKLVAEHFLEKPNKCDKIWHIDRNKNNCYYKNLMWVNDKENYSLRNDIIKLDDIERKQEYIPYITRKSNNAYSIWNGIYDRCYRTKEIGAGKCYEGAYMCDSWLNDQDVFVEWYNANYYECDGESMAVDKDLLFPGNKQYAPDKCCILPQKLNTMLSNCKKHRPSLGRNVKMNLPLGVRYDENMGMYYGQIKLCGDEKSIKLSCFSTPEEAFRDYKRFKQADILLMAVKYKNKIPKHIYEALLKVDVKPYVE